MELEDKIFLKKFLKGVPIIFLKHIWWAITNPFKSTYYDIGINGKVWIRKIS